MSGTITSSDNGTNIPSDDGFRPNGPFILTIAGGTTIFATLQVKTKQGNWMTVPDDSNLSTITGAWRHEVKALIGEDYRIAVVTATGTWDWEWSLLREVVA